LIYGYPYTIFQKQCQEKTSTNAFYRLTIAKEIVPVQIQPESFENPVAVMNALYKTMGHFFPSVQHMA
jgi:hypothetical protein